MKYAMQIKKSDLPLLKIINNGLEPKVEKRTTYLIINLDGPNEIITERELISNYEISQRGPFLVKLKK